jgi:two-component sensor histidine kinase
MVCIPVRWQDRLVAVLTRESALAVGRRPGELERTYVEVFDRLARMISHGAFPFPVDETVTSETPRVGDGVVVLDAAARVEFASPNAVNALHRMGLYSSIDGLRLEEAGLGQAAVDLAFQTTMPVTEEVTRDDDASIVIRCVPLLDDDAVTGAVVLLRDVTELRRRDRLLLSKDAAIREVHHRVKNNLQTISSLLRLQARRLPPGEGRHALEESERRVRSIALVHEILSRDTVDQVHFNDILPSLVRMAEDLGSTERPVRITCTGEAGDVQASVATPLAVVVTELLQNAAEHAYPLDRPLPVPAIQVDVRLERDDAELRLVVRDNGAGLPDGFRIENTVSLGLSIVRGLVGTQLGGTISMSNDDGTVVELVIPLDVVDDDLESL